MPGRHRVLYRGRERVLGREAVVRGEDAEAVEREPAGDRTVREGGARDEAAAVEVEQGRARRAGIALRPLARHAAQAVLPEPRTARRRERQALEHGLDLAYGGRAAQPPLDLLPDHEGREVGLQASHGSPFAPAGGGTA